MRVKLSTYFVVAGLVMSALLLEGAPRVGVCYLLAFIPLAVIAKIGMKGDDVVRLPVFLGCLAIFSFYFVRPLLIALSPEFFAYLQLGRPTRALQGNTMLQVGVFATAFLGGLLVALMKLPQGRLLIVRRSGACARLSLLYLAGLLSVALLWAVLVVGFGVAVKGEQSGAEAIGLVLPIDFLVPAAMGYFAHALVRPLTRGEKIGAAAVIAVMMMVTLARGSKAAGFLLVFYAFALLILLGGDLRLRASRVILGGVLVPLVAIVSVVAANTVRYQGVAALAKVSGWVSDVPVWGAVAVNTATIRLSAYDGLIATAVHHPEALEGVMSWRNALTGAAEKLLPGVSGSGISIGKAVGVYYGSHDTEAQHAGALGLFGTLYYMHGLAGGAAAAALIGLLFGVCFRLLTRAPVGTVERATMSLFLSYQLTSWLLSGNLDNLLQRGIIMVAHAGFYYMLVAVIARTLTRRADVVGVALTGPQPGLTWPGANGVP